MTPSELKQARQKLGLTQQKLADELGLSRVMVNQMEKGVHGIERRTELAVMYLQSLYNRPKIRHNS